MTTPRSEAAVAGCHERAHRIRVLGHEVPSVRIALGCLALSLALSTPAFSQHEHHGGHSKSLGDASAGKHAAHDHDSHAHHTATPSGRDIAASAIEVEIPPVPLVERSGETVQLSQLVDTDKTVLLNFIFTSCNAICPVMSSAFSGFTTLASEDLDAYRLISISIDPEYDTTEQLRAYAKRHAAKGDWHFLTGRLEDIVSTQRAFDAYRGSKMNHEAATYLWQNAQGKWIKLAGIATPRQILDEASRLRGQSDL